MVVVSRDQDHLIPWAKRLPDLAQDGLGRVQHLVHRALPELEHVPEQYEALEALKRLQQRRSRSGLSQDVAFSSRAEMQVGDDQRSQQDWRPTPRRPRAPGGSTWAA